MGCRKLEYYGREALGETTKNLEVVYAKKGMRKKKCINYYPFGMLQPGRTYSSNSYRYGYQGSEKDDEIKGSGNSYTTLFRMHDPRLGRWLSIDPKADLLPGWSPYVAMNNNPIQFNDPNGDFIPLVTGLVGAAAGAIVGLATGKSGKEILAYAAGGFVAGATFGVGTLAVAAAGGVAATSTAGALYIMGGSSIVGGVLGNLTEQTISNIGTDNTIDGNEAIISGVFGIPDAVLRGSGKVITKSTEKGLTNFITKRFKENASKDVIKGFKKDIAKDLRGKGLGRRQANKAANKAIDKIKNSMQEGFEATQVGVKAVGKQVEVTVGAVRAESIKEVKREITD